MTFNHEFYEVSCLILIYLEGRAKDSSERNAKFQIGNFS